MFEQYKSALEQEYNAKYNLEFMEGAEYGSEEGFEGDPGFLEGESFEAFLTAIFCTLKHSCVWVLLHFRKSSD